MSLLYHIPLRSSFSLQRKDMITKNNSHFICSESLSHPASFELVEKQLQLRQPIASCRR